MTDYFQNWKGYGSPSHPLTPKHKVRTWDDLSRAWSRVNREAAQRVADFEIHEEVADYRYRHQGITHALRDALKNISERRESRP